MGEAPSDAAEVTVLELVDYLGSPDSSLGCAH
jgi:hypothetical protein